MVERPQYSALIGQGLDMDSATSGRAPLPWEVELPPSCVFKEEVRVVTVPHTGVVKTCHKCRGNGGMTCNECYGKVGARVVTVWYLVRRMWWWSGEVWGGHGPAPRVGCWWPHYHNLDRSQYLGTAQPPPIVLLRCATLHLVPGRGRVVLSQHGANMMRMRFNAK